MVKYGGTRAKAENTTWEITPHFIEKLEDAKKWSRVCAAKKCEVGLWQVSITRRNYAVDLRAHTCSYGKLNVPGFHAIM
jgi:hypothetical protein